MVQLQPVNRSSTYQIVKTEYGSDTPRYRCRQPGSSNAHLREGPPTKDKKWVEDSIEHGPTTVKIIGLTASPAAWKTLRDMSRKRINGIPQPMKTRYSVVMPRMSGVAPSRTATGLANKTLIMVKITPDTAVNGKSVRPLRLLPRCFFRRNALMPGH